MNTALNALSQPGFQSLVACGNFPSKLTLRYRLFSMVYRIPTIFTASSCILSASEMASLYHFPYGDEAHAENLIESASRTLPAPVAFKRHHDDKTYDVKLGANKHNGSTTDIGQAADERARHTYILGGTGNGKTTLLQYAIVQDIMAGRGVAVIDPHGDLAQTLLSYIPEERLKDVVYLNPYDLKHPIGFNLLEMPKIEDEDEYEMEQSRVVSAVISVMRKLFSDDTANAHRIESMLRNTILTAMTVEGATIFTVLKLLRNKKYCQKVVAKLKDEDLKDFWREEMGLAGGMQFVSMTKPVTSRIDTFRSSPPAKRMLNQANSTINFSDIMDSGKILICNFAQGDIGEDTTALFGTMVLAEIKLAAEKRIRIPEADRKPFYLYVDEFQTFAAPPFLKMLSGARKFKLSLIIAEQSTAQQDEPRMTQQIMSNASTVITFRTGSSDDEKLILPRFQPQLEVGDIGNLQAYHFYMRSQAIQSLEPVSGETVLLEKLGGAADPDEVIASSRELYGGIVVRDEVTRKTLKPRAQPKKLIEKSDGEKKKREHSEKNKPNVVA